uniref:PARP14-like eighth type I KH domain-containing protein n=1 Tax=Hucho hucho TaxID=62062 RepID=A0A4W5NUV5_9TELE
MSRLQGFGHATDQYESRAPNEHRSPRGGATPHIELSSAYSDTLREATFWLTFIMSSDSFTIHNNFIQCFGQTEFDELLSFQTKWKVSIKENLKDGCASITIQGASRGIRAAVLEVEAMCCKVQEDFAKELENLMGLKSPTSSPRKPVDDNIWLWLMLQVEKVENRALRQLFDLKKLQVSTSPQQMYQRLPAQFCDLLSRVGFQKEFAPPDGKLGKGIYFSSSVSGAEKLWLKSFAGEEYLYFVEAEVLTGNSTAGSPDLIVPPPFGRDPLTLYDSVEEGLATFVVFNGHQALPKYLITLKCLASVSALRLQFIANKMLLQFEFIIF